MLFDNLCAVVLAVTAALLPAPSLAQEPHHHDLANEKVIVDMFAEVMQHHGQPHSETAAFIVRDEAGDYRCVFWPATAEYHHTHYSAAVPAGMIAIVHTHPFEWSQVSGDDRQTARKLGIPVYAVTRRSIEEADAAGREIIIRHNDEWMAGHRTGGLCQQPAAAQHKNGEKHRCATARGGR